MEVAPQSVSPHIQRVLKSFQTSADRTLQGPGHGGLVMLSPSHEMQQMAKLSSEEFRKALAAKTKADVERLYRGPPFPVQQMPVFTPVDTSKSEKTDTLLEGENIACFVVGGEKRLCLPQILNTLLRDYTLQQINTVCDDLHIFCSRCQPEQLEILKVSGILPPSAPSCGLITKTDAERLCNALIHTPNDTAPSHPSGNSFKVYHECFGKCKGVFDPEAYTNPSALCIQCVDCGKWFTPQKFVCHSHKALENRTCHWGFDSANWRHYLLLAKHQAGIEKLQDILEQIKARFDNTNKYKRKQGSDGNTEQVKRSKSSDETSPSPAGSPWSPGATTEEIAAGASSLRAMMSAFQPWSTSLASAMKDGKMLPAPPAIMREGLAVTTPSFLHSGPPVLLHPDKVVPHSESSRYEPNYAPNVSLAPVQKCKGEDDDEEEEEEVEEDSEPGEKKPKLPISATAAVAKSNGEETEVETTESEVPPPGQVASKVYREWDLSESEDSSVERSSPPQGENSRQNPSDSQRALEIELEMIRQALDGKIGEERTEKERFLREFFKLRAKHQELYRDVMGRGSPKSETSSKDKPVNGKSPSSEPGEVKDLDRMRRENEAKLAEIRDDKEKLLKDVKARQERDDLEMGKLTQINQELSTRLRHYELAFEQIRVENILMQEKLLQMGVNALELFKTNCNGSLKLLAGSHASPVRSPPQQRSPTENGSPSAAALHRAYPTAALLPPHGVMQSQTLMDLFVKKEREGCT